jgi:DHA2 family multidrug resistance protein
MVVVLAPAIGPTIGGWITDNYQWRWIFYMNVPVGILSLGLISRLVEDPAYLRRGMEQARRYLSIDYLGIALLALCLGSLQVVLDKGQEDDWFHSPLIAVLAVIFPFALAAFIVWELTRAKPVMDLRMFRNRNFAASAAMIFVFGLEIYSITVFTPQYVQAFLGYDAELAGMTQAPGALLLIVLMPIVGMLVRRVEARWLIAAGFVLSAFALFQMTNVDLQIDFRTAADFRVWASFGIALLFIPINTASYAGVPEEKGGEVSGTINLLRNIGGSVGISMLETMLARRSQFHQDTLVAHVTRTHPAFRSFIAGASGHLFHRGLTHPHAVHQAYLRMYDAVIAQATILSYMDVAWVIGVICIVMAPMALLLRPNDPKAVHVSVE